jgi:hypothetical protein
LGAEVELFSVPFDGSEPFVCVNEPLGSGETILNAFVPSKATRLMAYGIGLSSAGVTKRLEVVPIRRDLAPEQVNVTAVSGADGVQGYEVSADETYAVYLQDQETSGRAELYSHELDSDGDSTVNAVDNCPFAANPGQAAVVFGQTVLAVDETTFAWSTPAEARYVRGPLAGVDVLATDDSGVLADATSYADAAIPGAGAGYYYLFALDCAGRSYQSAPGAEPGRDLAALP